MLGILEMIYLQIKKIVLFIVGLIFKCLRATYKCLRSAAMKIGRTCCRKRVEKLEKKLKLRKERIDRAKKQELIRD